MKNENRIKKEYEDFHKTVHVLLIQSEKSNIQIRLENNDIRHWKGQITGPEDTVYQGGLFLIDITLPP